MTERLSEAARTYQLEPEKAKVMNQGRILLLAGIIGAGKDTVQTRLLTDPDYRDSYQRIITNTTRLPRGNDGKQEQDGVDYHFVSSDEMHALAERQELVELNQFGEHFYGVGLSELRSAFAMGKIAVSNIDVNGVESFKQLAPDAVTAVFLVPPDYETWRERAAKRYDDQATFETAWAKRQSITIDELQRVLRVPYYHFVINDSLDRAVEVVNSIAHRETDFFKRQDDEARLITRQLLDDIIEHA